MFKDIVRVVHNLPVGNDDTINAQCLDWIPSKLAQDVRSVQHFPQVVKDDWEQLVNALRENFNDKDGKMEFLSRMDLF